jgi:hypothetical protein
MVISYSGFDSGAMRTNWKLLAGFSLFGALISLISGIAGGNPFGVIVLRLLISAVLFAGLALGVQVILRRYLPDLLQGSPPPVRREGGNVDIIIDDELPSSAPADLAFEETAEPSAGRDRLEDEFLLQEVEAGGEPTDAGDLSAEPTPGAGDRTGGERDTSAAPGDSLEPVGLFEPTGSFEPDESYQADESFGPGDSFQEEERPPSRAASRIAAAGPSDAGDLEVLPEFDAFDGVGDTATEPSAEGLPGEEETPTRRAPATPRELRQAQIEETVKDQDPENLARAVRTFLKKDQ